MLCSGAFLAGLLLSSSAFAQQGPSNLNISGGLFNAAGVPITSPNVNFKIEILDKNSTCLLYTELHTAQDLSATRGAFSLIIGSGTSQVNNLEGTTSFDAKLFQNPGVVPAFTGCASGLTLSAGDTRLIRVSYDLGSGYVAMTPNVPITSSAYAMVAESLQGHAASDFILTNANSSLSQANQEYIFSNLNYANLKALVDGTSSQYILAAPGADVNFNSHHLTNVLDPSNPQDAATKSYSDTRLGGKTIDVSAVGPGIGGGRTIVWDSAAGQWITSATGSVGLVAAGAGLTGGNITASGTLSVDVGTTANKILQLDASARLPAVNASLLTNVNAVQLQGRNVSAAAPTAGQVISWNNILSLWEPSIPSGGTITALTGDVAAAGSGSVAATIQPNAVTAAKINNVGVAVNRLLITDATTGATVGYSTCGLGEVLQWTAGGWACTPVTTMLGPSGVVAGAYGNATQVSQVSVDAQGRVTALTNVNIAFPVTSVAGRTGAVALTAADITSGLGTAAAQNVGTGVNNVVQLAVAGQLPALDGFNLTNVNANANKISGKNVSSTSPTAGQILTYNNSSAQWEAAAAASTASNFVNGGNNFGAASSLGNQDNFKLSFLTNNSARLTIDAAGNVGIGTAVPATSLDVNGFATLRQKTWIYENSTTAYTTSEVASSNPYAEAALELDNNSSNDGSAILTRLLVHNSAGNAQPSYIGSVSTAGGGTYSPSIVFGSATGFTSYAERMRIDANGNVGIGTSTPSTLFDVAGVFHVKSTGETMGTGSLGLYDSGGWYGGIYQQGGGWLTVFDEATDYTSAAAANKRIAAFNMGGGPGAMYLKQTGSIGWSLSTTDPTFGTDVALARDSAQALGIWNAGNPTAFHVYNNSSGANYERAVLDWQASSNVLRIGTEAGGSGTVRNIDLVGGNVGIGTTLPQAGLDIATTGTLASAIIVPRDTAANRPSTAVNGMIRYNTNAAAFEGFANGTWGSLAGAGGGSQWTTTGSNIYYNLGNIGVGTAAPARALDIENISSPQVRVGNASGEANIELVSNAASLGRLNFNSQASPGTALGAITYDNSANKLGFATNQVYNRMVIDSSGNVGIGTTTPASRLAVQMTGAGGGTETVFQTYDTSTGNKFEILAGGTLRQTYTPLGNNNRYILSSYGQGDFGLPSGFDSGALLLQGSTGLSSIISGVGPASGGDGSLAFFLGGGTTIPNVVFRGSGNVGIGTTTPGYKLDVAGTINASALMINGVGVGTSSSPWQINGNSTFYSAGNVGIGTTTPSYKLQAVATDATPGAANALVSVSNLSTATNSLSGFTAQANNGAVTSFLVSDGLGTSLMGTPGAMIGTQTNDPVGLFTNSSERMRITAAGAIGIGTASPAARLHLKGNSANLFVEGDTSVVWNAALIYSGDDWAGGRTYAFGSRQGGFAISDETASAVRLTIDGAGNIAANGNVGIGTTSPTATLHLKAGGTAASSAPLKFTSSAGSLLTTKEDGAMEYDGTNYYLTVGSTRTAIPLSGGTGSFGVVDAAAGTAAAPSFSFTGDTNTGLYDAAVGTLGVAAGGVQVMSVTSTAANLSANKNFTMASGTGTFSQIYSGTGPAASITDTAAASGDILDLTTTSTTAVNNDKALSIAVSGANGTGGVARYGAYSNVTATGATSTNVGGYFSATGASNNYGLIVANGSVGIGTAAPSYPLQVTTTAADPVLAVGPSAAAGSNAYLYLIGKVGGTAKQATINATWAGDLNFRPAGGASTFIQNGSAVTALTVDNNANVGIGTTSPAAQLQIVKPAGGADTTIQIGPSVDANASAGIQFVGKNAGATNWASIYSGWDGTLSYTPAIGSGGHKFNDHTGAAKMTILESGNVGIGTTTPLALLDLSTTTSGQSAVIVPRDTAANRPTGVNGMIRYNTNSAAFEGFSNGAWGSLGTGGGAPTFPLLASPIGTAGAPAYSFSGSTSTGMYSPSANNLNLATNGVAQLAIDQLGNVTIGNYDQIYVSNTGWVGLGGNTNPQTNVDAAGKVRANSFLVGNNTSSYYMMELGNDCLICLNPGPMIRMHYGGVSNSLGLGPNMVFASNIANGTDTDIGAIGAIITDTTNTAYKGVLTFSTANNAAPAERVRIDNYGNVGIGTTAPLALLEVAGTGTNSAILIPRDTTANRPAANSTNGMLRYNTNSNKFEAYENGAWTNMIGAGGSSQWNNGASSSINYLAGKVGIGTTTPQATLDVTGAIDVKGLNGISFPASDTTAGASIAIGPNALAQQDAGAAAAYSNIAIGYDAMTSPMTAAATQNTAIGVFALASNNTGNDNTMIGFSTGAHSSTGNQNTALGSSALSNISSGSANTAVGYLSMVNNTLGQNDTAIGSGAALNTTGSDLTAIGAGALGNTSGNNNTALGSGAGWLLSSGANNTLLGYNVGSTTLLSGSNNILIGTSATVDTPATSTSNFLNIGNTIFATGMTGTVASPAGRVGIGTTTPRAGLDIATTGTLSSAIIVPRDTAANRPTGVNGMIRYNTTAAAIEAFANGTWTSIAGAGTGAYLPLVGGTLTGPLNINYNSTSPNLTLSNTDGTYYSEMNYTNGGQSFYTGIGGVTESAFGVANKYFVFDANANKMRLAIDTAGNVGIGTSSPALPLDVNGSGRISGALAIGSPWINGSRLELNRLNTGTEENGIRFNTNGLSDNKIYQPTNSDDLRIWGETLNQDLMTITQTGHVGIGTTTPLALLDLSTTTSGQSAIIVPRDTAANRPAGVNGMIRYNTNSAAFEGFSNGTWGSLGSGGASQWNNGASSSINYTAGNVGIGTATPNAKMEVNGALRLSGTTSDSFVSPLGAAIPTKINIPIYDPGAFGQVLALGLPSSAPSTARGITIVDARTVTHQPTIAVISPDESQIVGFTYDGSNTMAYVSSTVDLGFKVDNGMEALTLSSAAGTGAILTLKSINAADPNGIQFYQSGSAQLGFVGLEANRSSFDVTSQYFGIPLHLGTSGGTNMSLMSSGNVGIGTTAPVSGLDIATTGTLGSAIIVPRDTTATRPVFGVTNGMLRYNTNSNKFEAYENGGWTNMIGAGATQWTTNGTAVTYNTGNVGIGTTTPTTTLQIVNSVGPGLIWGDGGNNSYGALGTDSLGGNFARVRGQTGMNLSFGSNAINERMVLTTAGNFGIGTTSPAGILDVEGGTAAAGNGTKINIVAQNGLQSGNTYGGDINISAGNGFGSGSPGNITLSGNSLAGVSSTVGAPGAVALGSSNVASAYFSTALGGASNATAWGALAFGNGVTASGPISTAFGNHTNVSGAYSMTIGLGAPAGANPQVTGNSSLGIFLGDQSGANLLTSNTMAILGGKVGIGTTTPQAALDVVGNSRSSGQVYSAVNTVASGASIDFNTGNVQVLQSVGGSTITLAHVAPSAAYTVFITDTTPRTYSFTESAAAGFMTCTSKHYWLTPQGPTTGITVFTIVNDGTNCYISYATGIANPN